MQKTDDRAPPQNLMSNRQIWVWNETYLQQVLSSGDPARMLGMQDSQGMTGTQFGMLHNAEALAQLQPLIKAMKSSADEPSSLRVIVDLLTTIGTSQEALLEGQRRAAAEQAAITRRLERIEQRLLGPKRG